MCVCFTVGTVVFLKTRMVYSLCWIILVRGQKLVVIVALSGRVSLFCARMEW